jgi:hypothetical protein
MKEYPDNNFRIEVVDLRRHDGVALHKHLPDVLVVTINKIVRVSLGRSFASDVWPPEEASNFDEWESASDALLCVFNFSDRSVGTFDVETVQKANRED